MVAQRWREELAAWAVPDHILAGAPEPPWGFPVELFRVREDVPPPDTPSRRRALEALPPGGSVLDVGCGGGAASLALVPPAGRLIGVDQSAELLAEFTAAANRAGVEHDEVRGNWPDVAEQTDDADVVVCHHVFYNVPDLVPFAQALTRHARRRVVVELTDQHPLVATRDLWLRFHGIDRPPGPGAELAAAVLREAGLHLHVEHFDREARPAPRDVLVAMTRRRLCLPAERDAEIDEALGSDPRFPPGGATCLWWDPEVERRG
jgi:SAM-dependent methyltransferase